MDGGSGGPLGVFEALNVGRDQFTSLVALMDEGAKVDDDVEDFLNGALVEDEDGKIGGNELAGEVGLDVGEADDKVRLEGRDLAHAAADEGGDDGLVTSSLRRTDGVGADADDAVALAKAVEDFGWFFGEADDAPGPARDGKVSHGHGRDVKLRAGDAVHRQVP